jgi:hypothetical protein
LGGREGARAGSAEVENFRPSIPGFSTDVRDFPPQVQILIQDFLGGRDITVVATAPGSSNQSTINDRDYDRSEPF